MNFDKTKLDMLALSAGPSAGKLLNPMDGPIAGESLTKQPGNMPYERPPQYADPEDALHHIFMRLMKPQTTMQLLTLMDVGVAVDTLVEVLASGGAQEGLWSIPMIPSIIPALTVILIRMAQAAKIDPVIQAGNRKAGSIPQMVMKMREAEINSDQVEKAQKALKSSKDDVTKNPAKVGFMTPKGVA